MTDTPNPGPSHEACERHIAELETDLSDLQCLFRQRGERLDAALAWREKRADEISLDLRAALERAVTAETIVRDLASEDREFGVSCPWNCSGDSQGAGHADNCPWNRARALAVPSPDTTTEQL